MMPPMMFFIFLTALKGAATEATNTIPMSSREEKFRNLFESLAKNDEGEIHTNRDILIHEADRERKAFEAVKMKAKSKQRKRKDGMGLENLVRSRREEAKSSCSDSGYVPCDMLTDDKVFQALFRTPTILKPFLNDLLISTELIRQKLNDIEVRGDEQQIRGRGGYTTLHDVRARDSCGNSYVIEMERVCGNFDIIRFQHIASKVFSKLVDARAEKLTEKAEKDAVLATEANKKEAADVAREDAKKKGLDETETVKAVKAAVNRARKVYPKELSHSELYRLQDVPTVFMIVLTDGGLPVRTYKKKFESEDDYVLTANVDEFGEESKIHYVYVDLKRFGKTEKSTKPVSNLDRWCSLLWNSKEGRLKKELFRDLEAIEGISDIAKRVVQLNAEEREKAEAVEKRQELVNDLERGAMTLIQNGVPDAIIMEALKVTREKIQELREQMELD